MATRIGILSDTHSCWDPRFSLHFAQCDEIWHAGDIGDYDVLENLRAIGPKLRAVHGNIDYGFVKRECPEILIFTVEDCRVVMTHVGGYPGRYAPGIRQTLIDHEAKLFISGHSHILKVMNDPAIGTLHINPGAAGRHGWHRQRTLVRLTIDGPSITDLEVIELAAESR